MLLPTRCPVCDHDALIYRGAEVACDNCVYRQKLRLKQQFVLFVRTKAWWWRVPLILVFVPLLLTGMQPDEVFGNRMHPIHAFDLGIHELGHFLFMPFGTLMHIFGGSLFQCLFPLLWLGVCIWKRWFFAACLCLCWFGVNVFDVAVYAADAEVRLLPLTGLGGDYDAGHDWYQLLSRLDRLDQATAIAANLRALATGAMAIGITAASSLVLAMLYYSVNKPATPTSADPGSPTDPGSGPSSGDLADPSAPKRPVPVYPEGKQPTLR